jgi:hypothetical protein
VPSRLGAAAAAAGDDAGGQRHRAQVDAHHALDERDQHDDPGTLRRQQPSQPEDTTRS